MEIKNSQILLIESALNELHKIIGEKDSKIVQIQKDKDHLRDTITNNKYEFESITDENEKLKKQIKILYEKQNELREEIQEKDLEIRSAENSKRQAEKLIQTKNDSLISSMEEKIYDLNEQVKHRDSQIKELNSRNEHLQNIIELHNNEVEVLQYDNSNQKKQIKMLRESIEQLEKQIKRYEYNDLRHSSKSKNNSHVSSFKETNNVMLENLEKKLLDSQKAPITKNTIEKKPVKLDETNSVLTEEQILKNNLGL